MALQHAKTVGAKIMGVVGRDGGYTAQVADAKALLELTDRVKGKLGEAAILLGSAADGRVHLVASGI